MNKSPAGPRKSKRKWLKVSNCMIPAPMGPGAEQPRTPWWWTAPLCQWFRYTPKRSLSIASRWLSWWFVPEDNHTGTCDIAHYFLIGFHVQDLTHWVQKSQTKPKANPQVYSGCYFLNTFLIYEGHQAHRTINPNTQLQMSGLGTSPIVQRVGTCFVNGQPEFNFPATHM